MLENSLKGNIQFLSSAKDWKAAISLAAQPLLEKDLIEKQYIDAMIQNVLDNGNYIIILPRVAMPHARPEYGSKGVGISFLRLEEPVMFPGGVAVDVFFALASNTPDGHLELMAQLAEILSNVDLYEKLLQVESEDALLKMLNQ